MLRLYGIQFGWPCNVANMRHFEHLAPKMWRDSGWQPLTGLIVQPIIGYLKGRDLVSRILIAAVLFFRWGVLSVPSPYPDAGILPARLMAAGLLGAGYLHQHQYGTLPGLCG